MGSEAQSLDQVLIAARSELSRAVQALWPEVKLAPNVMPVFNLELGDFCTDSCRALADQLKLSASTVANQLGAELIGSQSDTFKWYVAGEYLNLRLHGELSLRCKPEAQKKSRGAPVQIILPQRADLPWGGYLRVAACAVLQGALAQSSGLSPTVIMPGHKTIASDAFDWVDCFRDLARDALSGVPLAFSTSHLQEVLRNGQQTTLWLYPNSIPRAEFSDLFTPGNRCRATTLERSKLTNLDEFFLVPAKVEAMNREQLSALILLLASVEPGGELDLSAALLRDRENLRWFMVSCAERFGALAGAIKNDNVTDLEKCLPEERAIIIRAFQQPAFAEFGGAIGEVEQWILACRDLLLRASYWLNHPTVRNAANEGRLSEIQRGILAGVYKVFSGMMHECRPFQGLEQARQ